MYAIRRLLKCSRELLYECCSSVITSRNARHLIRYTRISTLMNSLSNVECLLPLLALHVEISGIVMLIEDFELDAF